MPLDRGRVLHGYDSHPGDETRLVVVWHHGTPNVGIPPAPLAADLERLGLRWLSYDRPGYGGSSPVPDRDIASAAPDVAAVADWAGVSRFCVLGHSGGGPHALACAALLPDRVLAAVSAAGLAPFRAAGLEWYDGMGPVGAAGLRAASAGRAAKEAYEASLSEDTEPDFVDTDWQALSGPWGWLGSVVGPATVRGPAPLVDDDLAYVRPWGFDPAAITVPVLLVHGADDRVVPAAHSRWLSENIPGAELRLVRDAGHIAVLEQAPAALDWIRSTVS